MSLRWIPSIIYKLLNVVWDIWDFQNSLVYGKGRVHDKALHEELNTQIIKEFDLGSEHLFLEDRCLIYDSSRELVMEKTKEEKQAWLHKIHSSHQAVYGEDQEPLPEVTQQSILDYFNVEHNNM